MWRLDLFEWKTCAITIPEKKKQLFLRVNFWSVRRGVLNEKISSKQSHPMFSEHYFQLVINWWREDLTISPLLVNTDRERRSIYINIALSLCYKELPTRAIAVTGRQKRTQSTCILHRLHHVRCQINMDGDVEIWDCVLYLCRKYLRRHELSSPIKMFSAQ
jgi:hypothetical protein